MAYGETQMFWSKVTDPVLGRLRRWCRAWWGRVRLPGTDQEIDIVLEVPSVAELQPYLARVRQVIAEFQRFQKDLALPLFEDYCLYKSMDLQNGGCIEADYRAYPAVELREGIWKILKPQRLWHGPPLGQYDGNAFLLTEVAWPNPHSMQVFLQLEDCGWTHMHTEMVG